VPTNSRSLGNYAWILQNGESPSGEDLGNIWKGADGSRDAMVKQGMIRSKGLIYGLIF